MFTTHVQPVLWHDHGRPRPAKQPPTSENREQPALATPCRSALTSLPLAMGDVLAVAMATSLSAYGVCFLASGYTVDVPVVVGLLSLAVFLGDLLFGLYPGVGLYLVVELRQVSTASTLLFTVFGVASFGRPADAFFVGAAWVLTLVLSPIVRSMVRSLVAHSRWWGQPAIIFGTGDAAMQIYKSLESNPGLGLRPVGMVDDSYTYGAHADRSVERLSPEDASSEVRNRCVFWGIVAMPDQPGKAVSEVIERVFRERYPQLLIVPAAGSLPSLWNHAHDCGGMPAVRVVERLLLPGPQAAKRGMDLAITILGGLFVLPLVGFICLLVKLASPGPIFYSQKRIGLGGRHFQAWKFRTMVVDADKVLQAYLDTDPALQAEWDRDHKLKNDPRVTWIGHWLRKTSLDELPQLWNVMVGQMSLVGPRPIVDAEIEKYGETYRQYTKVVPGVTGLWQISGRNNTTYQKRVELDSFYVRNWSPWFDSYILVRTIKTVMFREGAY